MTDMETIEGEVAEIVDQLPAVVETQPPAGTLFRTDEPAEIVRRATEIANVLARVLKERKLTKRIGEKDHVLVEGWTFCGTMLGVFAVVEWTRQTDLGWEARAEARTLGGQVVGAAEAECLRSEQLWKNRDDYAIRSMAQTRAVSKALRAPLGFIVQLAGFEATPAEEMPAGVASEAPARRSEGPEPYPVPKTWAKVQEAVRFADNPDEAWQLFEAFVRAASYHQHGETDSSKLTQAQRKTMLQKASGAAVWLHENVQSEGPGFLFFDEAAQRKAWAAMLEGTLLEIPDYQPPEKVHADLDEEALAAAEAERIADEVIVGPPE